MSAANRNQIAPNQCDICLRYPPNWTAIGFFALLGGLHLGIALPAFLMGRIEGELSLLLGLIFLLAAMVCYLTRTELAVLRSSRLLNLRTVLGRVWTQRSIPFHDVHAVRMLETPRMRTRDQTDWQVELLCRTEDIECPPSPVPRQEALCLAILMNVRLIKVYADAIASIDHPSPAARLPVVEE